MNKMKLPKSKSQRLRRKVIKVLKDQTEGFQVVNPDAVGIDVGSEQMYVSVRSDRDSTTVRCFGAYTEDLHEIARWLKLCQSKSVVMESTGVYWIPLFQVLESYGFEVLLVNASHARNLPGRKTDVVDCQWLQKLHTFGLLSASFRPPKQISVIRSIVRHRDTIVKEAGKYVQLMQKSLTQMNVLVHKAVTDITGVTGMKIIDAIVSGQTDPNVLASFRDRRCKKDGKTIAKALNGDFRREHLFTLKQAYVIWKLLRRQIIDCDQELEPLLREMNHDQGKPVTFKPKHNPKQNQIVFNLRDYLKSLCGVDLTEVPGVDEIVALTVISELGPHLDGFDSSQRFCSWMALCPSNKISGGKILHVKTRKVVNRVANALRLAAQSLNRSQDALGAFYRKMRYKLGHHAALTATAHKLARIIYVMLKNKKSYDHSIMEKNQEISQTQNYLKIIKQAKNIGFELIPINPVECMKESTLKSPIRA